VRHSPNGGIEPTTFLVHHYQGTEREVRIVKVQAETADDAAMSFDLTSHPTHEILMVEEYQP
jgi:hypothetical protein